MQQLTNFQEIEAAINEYGEIVVSKNKKDKKVVIMSIEEYKKKILKKEIEKHLIKSEEDIENGRVVDASRVFEEWNTKYGI